ncbi:unnamed protein product, partial [Mesorhabditis belari]|uniref:BPTI/Kunitz inhibitor domain-containing protein n=1 Tax=Mesorhabditis belari TaxID=2138241 RepID=A0AAF3EAK7_9BILA
MRVSICLLFVFLSKVLGYCEEGVSCFECDLKDQGSPCNTNERLPYYFCSNETRSVLYDSTKYLICVNDEMRLFDCAVGNSNAVFNPITRQCVSEEMAEKGGDLESLHRRRYRRSSSSSRVGDVCSFNTDCQRGMYCGGGVCSCLSDFVAINNHCWQKINPGESGCVEDRQCQAVWPQTTCSGSGVCDCPENTVPSRTRDGTICVSAALPPSCPLPEPHSDSPNPATVLANPDTHPIHKDTYMPVLCTSTSTEVHNSNSGDGSTWCIYPDGDNDLYIADIYDCVSHPQVSHQVFPEYAETVDGVCCPSRAFACIQPMESGPEPSVPRWWFNSATGTCVQFLWDPDTINSASPNNFRTIEHCESYCRDTCKRGPTEYSEGKVALIDDTPLGNCLASGGNRCGPDYQCTLIGSQQSCCPSTTHICSSNGGRSYPAKPLANFDRGIHIAGSKPATRYYYDADQGRCVNFIYQGLGNFNNFLTKQDCESFCSKLVCENGHPLRIGDEWQRCEGPTDCPTSHTCQSAHKVCCPTAQTLCTQPKRLGDCTQSGNDNNFPTLLQCQQKCKGVGVEPRCPHGRAFRNRDGNFQTCSDKGANRCPANHLCFYDGTSHGCCPTKAFTCSLNPDKGVQCGSGKSYRYYFNPQKQTCETFQYEGCDGNSNNFLTAEECQAYCGVGGCPNGGMPLRDQATNRQMSCSELRQCPNTHDCIAIPHNGNVEHRCCPTKVTICSQPPQQGNHCSKMSVARFYFNIVTKECASFQYNGCNGNLNNFASASECYNFCSSAGCRVGEVAYKDVNTKRVFDCNNNLRNSCPPEFTCRHNALTASYVCCGSTSMEVCPMEERAFVNPLDETIRECAINIPGSCPANFLCRFSPHKNKYYCCAPNTENVCPEGKALYRAPKTLLPQRCTLNVANQCHDGYSCQSRTKNVLQGFCCSAKNVCRGDAEFLVDEKTRMPRICTPGSFVTCPAGYRCHRSHKSSSSGFCCKGDTTNAVTEGCPPGEFAYVKRGLVEACDPFNPENKPCPPTYTCQYSTAFQRYQCCGKDPIEEEEVEQEELGCPAQQVAYVERGIPLVCTASGQNCPQGYFCQFSDRNKQFQCCGHRAGCPSQTVAFIDMTGGAMECNPQFSMCPPSYNCVKGRNARFVCCTNPDSSVTSTNKSPLIGLQPSAMETTTASSKLAELVREVQEVECPIDTVNVNGECKMRQMVGKSCSIDEECLGGARCLNTVCTCPHATLWKAGACVSIPACTGSEVLFEGECLSLGTFNDPCLTSLQCTNGTVCAERKCRCATGTVGFEGRCLANLCGESANPIVDLKGEVLACSRALCPSGRCQYSKMIKMYICCETTRRTMRKFPVLKRPQQPKQTFEQCPGGQKPLTVGPRNVLWSCIPAKGCPKGYQCIDRMCCPLTSRHKRESRPECPQNRQSVFIDDDGKRLIVCEQRCLSADRRSMTGCPLG